MKKIITKENNNKITNQLDFTTKEIYIERESEKTWIRLKKTKY